MTEPGSCTLLYTSTMSSSPGQYTRSSSYSMILRIYKIPSVGNTQTLYELSGQKTDLELPISWDANDQIKFEVAVAMSCYSTGNYSS